MKVVLAHGVLGFGVLGPLEYFNGVAAHLHGLGVDVATAHVNPIGSVEERAKTLAQFIAGHAGTERVCIFAHSMGGLDARHALSKNLFGVAGRVAALVTIGTPHLGSPVADAIEHGDPAALRNIPTPIVVELQINQRALHDLTTAAAAKADAEMTDVPGIRYIHVAGDTQQGAHASLAFRGVDALFGVHEPNDGVVTMTSASTRCGKRQDVREVVVWPTDHAGEIGWNLNNLQPVRVLGQRNPLADESPLARYAALVDALRR